MEGEVKTPQQNNTDDLKNGQVSSVTSQQTQTKNFSTGWYILGGVFLFIALCYLLQANAFLFGTAKIFGTEYGLMMKEYVGGDAYNIIIAGTYSTTLTVRALIFTVLSCSSIIVGKLSSLKK